ncbi:hypothetical protein NC652_036580 [Populus alba x Populus x berolinensis]|nr:hypothetical protein NC652_036580 [Populus alba x Populus x berolinensis]
MEIGKLEMHKSLFFPKFPIPTRVPNLVPVTSCWMLQTELSLYVDAFILDGCHKLLDVVSGVEGSTKCELEDSRWRAVAILGSGFCGSCHSYGVRRLGGSYEALPTAASLEENERTLLLSKSIETLEKYKILEDAFSLLQSSRNISRVETVKEKRRMAVQFSKAGLSPQGDQPFKRNHETASFEIEAGLDEIQSKMHMDEKGHLQPMVIGREVQNHASFSLVCHNPVSGNELGLNGRSVSALSAE